MKKKELIKYFTENNKSGFKSKGVWLKKNNKDLFDSIEKFSKVNGLHLSFKEKIWHFINNKTEIPECYCGNKLKFKKSLLTGYGLYCSRTCTNKCQKHKDNVSKTNVIKYGGVSPSSDKKVLDKIKKTTKEKYGVDNIFKNLNYIKEKTLEKHGIDHISKLESVKFKIKETNLKNLGVSTPLLISKNRNKSYTDRRNTFNVKYDSLDIKNINGDDIIIKCDNCNKLYTINRTVLYHRNLITSNPCTLCHPIKSGESIIEKEIAKFITDLGIYVTTNDRNIIQPLEMDINIPNKKIGIELNGLYWHSEKYVSPDYHLNKTILSNNSNYKLIHIFEDEWLYKKEIVKSRLKNILGLTDNKIYARKCEVREVKTKDKSKFLNDNHIQGAVGSKINLGLYFNDELVSIMTFGKRPFLNDYEYELIRFCNKLNTSVVGGASKLLKHFLRTYKPSELISYADRRWSTGNLYEKLGFTFSHFSKPNWFIVNGKNREHRVKYQKHKLVNMGFNGGKTAHEICIENGLYRIYDCGTITYKLDIKKPH